MSPPEAQRLADALHAMPPRDAKLLLRAVRAERPLEAVAAAHGVDVRGAAVLLAEALERLGAQLDGKRWRPGGWAERSAQAETLARALTLPASTSAAPRRFRELQDALPETQAALEEALRREDEAPARRVEEWLRGLAILAILAIVAWSYVRS